MTDTERGSPYTHRMIDDAARDLMAGVIDNNEGRSIETATYLFAVGLHALVDIADAAQRLAAATERDLAAAINTEADVIAEEKIKETKKRSFFGKPPE